MSDVAHGPSKRIEWVWGGALLVASVVIPFGVQYADSVVSATVRVLAEVAFLASMLVFALGKDSVVARRPLGAAALIVLGAWPFTSYLWGLIPQSAFLEANGTPDWVILLSYTLAAVQLAVAVVAVVQIARAGVVPARFRWLPLWAVGLAALPSLLVTLFSVALGQGGMGLIVSFSALGGLASFVAVVGTGVVAIVLGLQPRPVPEASTQIYPPLSQP